MSVIATATSAAAPPTISFHPHGHKKGIHGSTSTESSSSSSNQAPATTQGLFSTLLQSLEQVIGVPAILGASAAPAAAATSASGAPSATNAAAPTAGAIASNLTQLLQTVQSTGRSSSSVGTNVNAKV